MAILNANYLHTCAYRMICVYIHVARSQRVTNEDTILSNKDTSEDSKLLKDTSERFQVIKDRTFFHSLKKEDTFVLYLLPI